MKQKKIYCTKIRIKELDIFFASCKEGALRTGISWAKDEFTPVQYFKRYFPKEMLVEDKERNLPLIEAVINAYKNRLSVKLSFAVKLSSFQLSVLNAIKNIKPGTVKTYKQVAEMINKPKAYRAVGQALRRNPFPLLFP